ncbi:hypothetical protein VNI00_008642 [Paramarasmius palmivorus]|uniref:F-box domain-containing protein n=1 Tax=Paramarasmius palmivorus TaxID=297713 RepID=A0AAW0CYS1_9AGAR
MSVQESKDPTQDCRKIDIQQLRTNQVPSDEETLQMRGRLEVEMAELEELEAKIAQGHDAESRETTRQPFRKLPIEVLEEILSHTCLGKDPNEYGLVIRSITTPSDSDIHRIGYPNAEIVKRTIATTLILSQVCSHWRNVIADTPRLWSSLSLDVIKMTAGNARLVSLHLRRSAKHPLTVDLRETFRSYAEDFETKEETVQVLGSVGLSVFIDVMNELHRFRQLHYGFGTDTLLLYIEPIDSELPLLESFSTCTSFEGVNLTNQRFWNSIIGAPNLIYLTCIKYGLDYRCHTTNARIVTLAQMESYLSLIFNLVWFSLSNVTTSISILDFSPARESMQVFDETYLPEPYLHATFHHLTYLRVTSSMLNVDLRRLFSGLTLPALEVFILELGCYSPPWSGILRVLERMFGRSGCSLQEMKLHMVGSSFGEDVVSLLESVPSLVSLSLEGSDVAAVLSGLCARISMTPGLLPNLRYLAGKGEEGEDCSDAVECLSKMLEARVRVQ